MPIENRSAEAGEKETARHLIDVKTVGSAKKGAKSFSKVVPTNDLETGGAAEKALEDASDYRPTCEKQDEITPRLITEEFFLFQ